MSRSKKIVVAVIAVTVLGIAAVGCAETPSEQSDEAAKPAAESTTEAAKPAEKKKKAAKPAETVAQENARRSAESYLDLSGFSRSGLIEQLEYEGFTPAQAAYAADKVGL